MQTLEQGVQAAWNYIFKTMYNENTGVIYDYRTATNGVDDFAHLPTPTEVQAQIPSPCGWYAGIENGAIFVGLALSSITNRYKVTKDESLHEEAVKILKGLKSLTSVSGVRGFLARSVHPKDGKSFYFESSRDQYTIAVYGIDEYLDCPLCTNEEKAFLTDVLVGFAEYAEKCVTKENDWQILRADGKDTMVCKMLYSEPHEWTRLPMIYVAAWKASGNEHWKEKYLEIRDLCIDGSFKFDHRYWKGAGAIDQMQYSLALLYKHEEDELYREKYERLCENVASFNEPANVAMLEEAIKTGRRFDDVPVKWRDQPFTYLHFWGAPRGNYPYFSIARHPAFAQVMGDLIGAAKYAIIEELQPNKKASELRVELLEKLFTLVDFDKHCTEAPNYMLQAYWMIQANKIK